MARRNRDSDMEINPIDSLIEGAPLGFYEGTMAGSMTGPQPDGSLYEEGTLAGTNFAPDYSPDVGLGAGALGGFGDREVATEAERKTDAAAAASANSAAGGTTGTTSATGVPKKTAAELLAIINSDPTKLNLNDIDYNNQELVNEVVAALQSKINAGSGSNRYEVVLNGTAQKPAGVYDRISGQLVQKFDDTEAIAKSAAEAQAKYNSIADGQSADYVSQLAALQDAQKAVMGGTTQEDLDKGYDRLNALMGANYKDTVTGLAGDVAKGISGQEGLSADEKALYGRQNAQSIAQELATARRQLDSIKASTGSTMSYLAAADEVRSKITNMRTSQDVAMMNADVARREKNYEAKAESYYKLVEQGRISMAEYESGLRADRFNAFKAASETLSQIADRDKTEVNNLRDLANTLYTRLTEQTTRNTEAFSNWMAIADAQVAPLQAILQSILNIAGLTADSSATESV